MKLSVVWATRNEEANIARSIESVVSIADEMIVVDEYSTDKTKQVAEKLGAKVYSEPHHEIFHITKQKAIDLAKGDWILQMDADEVIAPSLAREIMKVVNDGDIEIRDERKKKLFLRHQELLEERDGKFGTDTGEVVAYFIPRANMFLGKPLIHAGVYPDGVIRLFKKGRARLPGKSVHEQMEIDGKVGWLENNLLHYDSPTLKRYLMRLNRYTDLQSQELRESKVEKNLWFFLKFSILLPAYYFLLRYFRHKGFLDGVPGFLWSFFSASHFPVAYFKYVTDKQN